MADPTTTGPEGAEPLRKITACSCGHPLAEHYANGCGWCICKVAGTATEDAERATTTAACRCDGRYDGCEHGRRCPNAGGSSHSPFFCTDCDPRRRAHITRNLERIADEHIRSGT